MPNDVSPFVLFNGEAEEAINFYLATFKRSRLERIVRYGIGGMGAEGTVMHASLFIAGQKLIFVDSAIPHDFKLNPSQSFFVNCESIEEVEQLHAGLIQSGKTLMPIDSYEFSPRYCWIIDKFGLSWQLAFQAKAEPPKPAESNV